MQLLWSENYNVDQNKKLKELISNYKTTFNTDTGKMISSKVIMKMIEKFVENENPMKPLSDNQISENFTDKGISIARRTITKYREKLNIPSSTERKKNTHD